MERIIYKTYDPTIRRHTQIWPDESEMVPGMILIKMFYCPSAGGYVSIPGASLFRVNDRFELEAIND